MYFSLEIQILPKMLSCSFASLSSSSSGRAISMDIPDPLSPHLPIVHCFRLILRATFRITSVPIRDVTLKICRKQWTIGNETITYENECRTSYFQAHCSNHWATLKSTTGESSAYKFEAGDSDNITHWTSFHLLIRIRATAAICMWSNIDQFSI